MNDIQILLIGIAIGSVRIQDLNNIVIAAIAKRAGVKPSEVRQYDAATDGDEDAEDSDT